jgi:hypothetical protein
VLSDLAAQLLFPRIFRAAPAAARPERLLAGLLAVLILGVGAAVSPWNGEGPGVVGRPGPLLAIIFDDLPGAVARMDLLDLHQRARLLFYETPRRMIEDGPGSALILLIAFALAWGGPGLFIARGAGLELGRHIHVRTGGALRFVRVKGPAATVAMLLLPSIVLGLLAVPALSGLLLGAPGFGALGALLHGFGLVAGILAALLLVVWSVALWLGVPAVACDGADAFDATQRAMGMMLSRPISIGAHLLLALGQGGVLIGLVWLVTDLGWTLAAAAGGLFSDRAHALLSAQAWRLPGAERSATGVLLAFWHALPALFTLAYAVSYAHTAAVAVYLNARQMVDGQEPNELWMPGEPSGITIAPRGSEENDEED